MYRRTIAFMAICSLFDFIYALFLALAHIQTLTTHVFFQTLAKIFIMLSLNIFAIPLIVFWLPPWWIIYVIVMAWISKLVLYYWMQQEEGLENQL